MAANAFVEYYERHQPQGSINLKSFLQDELADNTPKKLEVAYDSEMVSTKVKKMKECILYNLYLNAKFISFQTKATSIEGLYNLFKQPDDQVNESQVAQLIATLHFSKSDLKFKHFIEFFINIDRLEVADFADFIYYNDLNDFFHQLIKSKPLGEKIENAILDLTGLKSEYKFESTSIKFFIRNYQLNGFAGKDTIYVNTDLFTSIIADPDILEKNHPEEDLLTIIKMQMLQIYAHEIIHVAISFMNNDMNVSTPKVKKEDMQTSLSSDEPGLFMEKLLFKEAIDWSLSAEKDLNVKYCKQFIDEILNDSQASFDIEKANVVIDENPISIMGIDFNFNRHKPRLL